MKFSDQFCTLQQGLILKQAGVKGGACYRHINQQDGPVYYRIGNHQWLSVDDVLSKLERDVGLAKYMVPVLSVGELGVILADIIPLGFFSSYNEHVGNWQSVVSLNFGELETLVDTDGHTEAESRAYALIELMDMDFDFNHLFIPEAINSRLENS
jgi:hypothetical protein